jgi:hypothetical protein
MGEKCVPDDIVSALTREVKEEVIENYLYERRLIEAQINYVNELAEHAAELEEKLYRRFARIYEYLLNSELINHFVRLIGMKEALFEARFRKDPNFRKGLRFIKVRGITRRTKFKKLLWESYCRLFDWNKAYKEGYENLEQESKASNQNLKKFEADYDLIVILNFLKGIDVEQIQKRHWLGDNFSPEEIGSIETTLRLRPIRMEQFELLPPPDLPEPKTIEKQLGALADRVYAKSADRIRTVMK